MSQIERAQAGLSLAEVVTTLALLALVAGLTAGALRNQRNAMTAAQLTSSVIAQARFLSVYRGTNHFVVIDPGARTLAIHEDSGTTPASFDAGDPLVSRTRWPGAAGLELPPPPASLGDPLLGNSVSLAWSLPLPDTSASWGSDLRGVMLTPRGRIFSAESTPQPIAIGTVVFQDSSAGVAAVSLDGRAGSAFPFRLENGSWKRL